MVAMPLTLIGDALTDGAPVFAERGADFITSNVSSLPERAGVWQGIRGSVTIVLFVVRPVSAWLALHRVRSRPAERLGASGRAFVLVRRLLGPERVKYLAGFLCRDGSASWSSSWLCRRGARVLPLRWAMSMKKAMPAPVPSTSALGPDQ